MHDLGEVLPAGVVLSALLGLQIEQLAMEPSLLIIVPESIQGLTFRLSHGDSQSFLILIDASEVAGGHVESPPHLGAKNIEFLSQKS